MKRSFSVIFTVIIFLVLAGCSSETPVSTATTPTDNPQGQGHTAPNSFDGEMTINFSFGTRTGVYSGEVNDQGLPHGRGTFSAQNTTGEEWTYEGDWVDGHWEGRGTSTWSSGQVYSGEYLNDAAQGEGTFYFTDGTYFEGTFEDDDNAIGVAVKDEISYYAAMIDGILNIGGVWRTGEFGDEIEPFQGEWEKTNSKNRYVIISGESINFVRESDIGGKHFRNVTTFYFGFNENGELIVVNKGDKPCYNISIDEDGILSIVGDDRDDAYQKISDSIEVPAERKNPEIGMTESEVYASTWGAPKKRNKTTTAQSKSEQWVYEFGYIYFENGIVTAIQEI